MRTDGRLPFSKNDVVVQCVVQLLLIDLLQDTIDKYYKHIPTSSIIMLLDALHKSYVFAQEFNQQICLREELKRLGFMSEMKHLPGLLKQEREALSCSLKILFHVLADRTVQKSKSFPDAMDRLTRLSCSFLSTYIRKEQFFQEQVETAQNLSTRERESLAIETEREILGLVPIISDVLLKGLKELETSSFRKYVPQFMPLFCELTVVNSREVRMMLRDVLLIQVAPMVAPDTWWA